MERKTLRISGKIKTSPKVYKNSKTVLTLQIKERKQRANWISRRNPTKIEWKGRVNTEKILSNGKRTTEGRSLNLELRKITRTAK